MEEQFIRQVKTVSHEIVANEFPDEEEYFDFLFDLTIQEIEGLEPGEEAEFLKEIRTIHPEFVLGYTPIIIILTVQILGELTHDTPVPEKMMKDKIADVLEHNPEKVKVIYKYFKNLKENKKRNKTK